MVKTHLSNKRDFTNALGLGFIFGVGAGISFAANKNYLPFLISGLGGLFSGAMLMDQFIIANRFFRTFFSRVFVSSVTTALTILGVSWQALNFLPAAGLYGFLEVIAGFTVFVLYNGGFKASRA